MKRTFLLSLAALAGVTLFAGLVYTMLRVAHVSEPAVTTIHGPTLRRLWATSAVGLALAGALLGSLAVSRPAGRFATGNWRRGVMIAGVIAAINGGLVLAAANGGPGSGNGVVGGAAALVLGLAAVVLGCLSLARSRTAG
ncbi:MAG TPA: DUF6223 family protein [Opitutaceae bacterium]|nr:DUF6223 family protein [Opitutaceae bacterium]